MQASVRLIAVTTFLLVIFLVLASVQSSSASYRRFRDFISDPGYLGSVCIDGVSVGFPFQSGSPYRKVEISLKGKSDLVVSEQVTTSWSYLENDPPYTTTPHSPFCQSLKQARPFLDPGLCSGIHYVRWTEPLSPGTEIDMYLYSGVTDASWESMRNCNPKDPESCIFFQEKVEDCRLGDNWARLLQTAPNTTTSLITDVGVFEVYAVDPDMAALRNGDGIEAVVLQLIDPLGSLIQSSIDTKPPYCLFGETSEATCEEWQLAVHAYFWPDGSTIIPGRYLLRASVDGFYSNDETVDWPIEIKRADWINRLHLPFVQAD